MRSFEDSFIINSDNSCWEWIGPKHKQGYGYYKQTMAHRYSYQYYNGEFPKELHVLHKCDNPSCVNPEHLFLGTHSDNMRDMFSKGRCKRDFGEKHRNAKLTVEQVLEIRTRKKSIRAYAKEFNVCYATVREAQIGKNWNTVNSGTLDLRGGNN